MDTLTREHEAAPAVAEDAPATAPEAAAATRPCPTCGAQLAADQEWCLECGTARPDRAAAAPGWAGASAVLIVTGVLAVGAVAAAWAGLSADAKRVAAPNAQASLPAQPQPQPPAQPQAAPPAKTTTPPPAKPAKPRAAKPKKSTPPAVSPPAPATPAPSAAQPATPAKPKPKPTHTTTTTTKLVAVDLGADAARTYNPYGRPENDFTDARQALDGDKSTSWTATLANDKGNAVGVDLDLGKLTGVRSLQVLTTTPGMTVEIYATREQTEPVSIQDPGWDHVATQLDVGNDERIRLGDGTKRYRHVLIWPTEGPPEGDRVALTELELFR